LRTVIAGLQFVSINKQKDPDSKFILGGPVSDDDIYNWIIYIHGPDKTCYEKALFKIMLKFPVEYPFNPPQVTILDKIYHPNVSKYGSFCLLIETNWSPAITVRKIANEVYSRIGNPSHYYSYSVEIAAVCEHNLAEFELTARSYVRKYSMPYINNDVLSKEVNKSTN